MEEYYNLISPLDELGLFIADEESGSDPTNKYILNIPDRIQLFKDFRKYINYASVQDYSKDISISFPDLLKQEGINVRVTSGYRKNSKTKLGRVSHHSELDEYGNSRAFDIVPVDGDFDNLRNLIYSNERIKNWLRVHRIGILEEITPDIMKRTGATGKHFHVGPDKVAIAMSSKYIDYSKDSYTPTFSPGKMGSKAYPLGGGKSTIDPNGMYSMFNSFGYGTNRTTKRTGVECAKVVAKLLMSYMDKGCKTLQDLIMMYHLGMSGTWDSVKAEIRRRGGLRDQGTKKWIPAEDWIRMQETYQKHCSEYMHMPMNTRVSKSKDFLYPLITFISRLETSKNSEAATAIALQQMRIA